MTKPLCFVLMPFGTKPNIAGGTINFDLVYKKLIAPAIEQAGLEPLRADEEMTGGIIHKPMFERLIMCEYAVADLTTANANVFYELGVRHAVRPWSTVLLFAAGGSQLPFDVAPLRALPYTLTPAGTPADVEKDKEALAQRLIEAKKADTDSPLFQLVDGYPDIDHTKTDVFRDQVQYSAEKKTRLAQARDLGRKQGLEQGLQALRALEQELGDLEQEESGVIIDLFLSYRAVKAWPDMIALVEKMPPPLAATVMVQEQLALALNRNKQGEEAERVLLELLAKRGPSSETYGILGRVYKDRWDAAVQAGDEFLARGLLKKAIDAYLKGFEADWRDAYPGINVVTLMELQDPPDPRRQQLLPVVDYAVDRRLAAGEPDYWDHATRLEVAVLRRDEDKALGALGDALAAVRETWEPETTANNLRLINEARARRQEEVPWAVRIEQELRRAAQE
jgi:tetratricopeptide (TPR) repeat protein